MKTTLLLLILSCYLFGQTIDSVETNSHSTARDVPSTIIRYVWFPSDTMTLAGTVQSFYVERQESSAMNHKFALYAGTFASGPTTLLDSTLQFAGTIGWLGADLVNQTATVTSGTGIWVAWKNSITRAWKGTFSGGNYVGHRYAETPVNFADPWPATATVGAAADEMYNIRIVVQLAGDGGFKEFTKFKQFKDLK